MKKLILIFSLVAMLVPARASWAQVLKGNDTGVSMGHVHFLVPDVDAAKKFWTAMGGLMVSVNGWVAFVPTPLLAVIVRL